MASLAVALAQTFGRGQGVPNGRAKRANFARDGMREQRVSPFVCLYFRAKWIEFRFIVVCTQCALARLPLAIEYLHRGGLIVILNRIEGRFRVTALVD